MSPSWIQWGDINCQSPGQSPGRLDSQFRYFERGGWQMCLMWVQLGLFKGLMSSNPQPASRIARCDRWLTAVYLGFYLFCFPAWINLAIGHVPLPFRGSSCTSWIRTVSVSGKHAAANIFLCICSRVLLLCLSCTGQVRSCQKDRVCVIPFMKDSLLSAPAWCRSDPIVHLLIVWFRRAKFNSRRTVEPWVPILNTSSSELFTENWGCNNTLLLLGWRRVCVDFVVLKEK